jgi:alpha-mannosidase
MSLVNTARDFRMRAHVRLPFRVESALTENQFHVAQRSIVPPPWNGRSNEQPPTTFPQKTFAALEADGHGLAIFNRGLPEGEVISDKKGRQAYALTLMRAVGWLSRNDLRTRRGGAGPMIATPGAQMPGPGLTFSFALTTYRGDWQSAAIQPLAHAWAIPPVAWATNEHDGDLGPSVPLTRIPDPALVPSAFHRSHLDGAPIVRVYNASDEARDAVIEVPAGSAGAGTTDLLERHRTALFRGADGWRFPVRPWEIATVRFGGQT